MIWPFVFYPQFLLELLYSYLLSLHHDIFYFSAVSRNTGKTSNCSLILRRTVCILSTDHWDFIIQLFMINSFITNNPNWYSQVWWAGWAPSFISSPPGQQQHNSLCCTETYTSLWLLCRHSMLSAWCHKKLDVSCFLSKSVHHWARLSKLVATWNCCC